jgi:hypothetical protein
MFGDKDCALVVFVNRSGQGDGETEVDEIFPPVLDSLARVTAGHGLGFRGGEGSGALEAGLGVDRGGTKGNYNAGGQARIAETEKAATLQDGVILGVERVEKLLGSERDKITDGEARAGEAVERQYIRPLSDVVGR